MNQVLICLIKNNGRIRLDVLDKRRTELVALGNALRVGDVKAISKHVKKALDEGATVEDIKKVAAFVVGDDQLVRSLLKLQRVLNYEATMRHGHISIIDDCREE